MIICQSIFAFSRLSWKLSTASWVAKGSAAVSTSTSSPVPSTAPVTDLTAGDFRVTADRVEKRVESAEFATGVVDVMLLLDSSLLGEAAGAETSFSLDRGAREQLRLALEAAGGHRERAANLLGISRATIYRKIKEYGLARTKKRIRN